MPVGARCIVPFQRWFAAGVSRQITDRSLNRRSRMIAAD
jgi:hypothetical protein